MSWLPELCAVDGFEIGVPLRDLLALSLAYPILTSFPYGLSEKQTEFRVWSLYRKSLDTGTNPE